MNDTITADPQLDRFHLFYVEAIMHDSSFPQINKVRPVFENLSLNDFIELMEKSIYSDEYEVTQQFLYFLLLFRDLGHLREYLNSDKIGIEILEKMVMFVYGHCTMYDHSTEYIIDEVLSFLNNDRLLALVIDSKLISRDKLLLFFILSRFDIELLNKYFKHIRNINEFIDYFLKLPEEVLRSIISRNYHLFQYIMLMMAEGESKHNVSKEFFEKYRSDIELFSRLSDMVRKIKVETKNGDNSSNSGKPERISGMPRIPFLVNMLKDLPDPDKAIQYFDTEHVFMNENEKKIVLTIINDPLMKNTLKNYATMLHA